MGSFVPAIPVDALAAAKKVGTVTIIREGTACKTPDATTYINKVKTKGILGKKKWHVANPTFNL
ncbi:MAG TPA: hypothetical protein VKG26_02000 [Bacteroidia bacterium]|nr:hypothetical protein [Bacteroidia bacterium]